MTSPTKELQCSFCGASQADAEQLIAADPAKTDVAICNVCIEMCRDILGAARAHADKEKLLTVDQTQQLLRQNQHLSGLLEKMTQQNQQLMEQSSQLLARLQQAEAGGV